MTEVYKYTPLDQFMRCMTSPVKENVRDLGLTLDMFTVHCNFVKDKLS